MISTAYLRAKSDRPQTVWRRPLPPKRLPTMYDLPSENPDEPGLPDDFHYHQPQLLRETFCPPNYSPEQFYVASDLNLYYDVRHHDWYKRPDWFVVLGVPPGYGAERDMRYSYVIWQEQIAPFIVVELLSEGTEKEDLGQTTQLDLKTVGNVTLLYVPHKAIHVQPLRGCSSPPLVKCELSCHI